MTHGKAACQFISRAPPAEPLDRSICLQSLPALQVPSLNLQRCVRQGRDTIETISRCGPCNPLTGLLSGDMLIFLPGIHIRRSRPSTIACAFADPGKFQQECHHRHSHATTPYSGRWRRAKLVQEIPTTEAQHRENISQSTVDPPRQKKMFLMSAVSVLPALRQSGRLHRSMSSEGSATPEKIYRGPCGRRNRV